MFAVTTLFSATALVVFTFVGSPSEFTKKTIAITNIHITITGVITSNVSSGVAMAKVIIDIEKPINPRIIKPVYMFASPFLIALYRVCSLTPISLIDDE